jgi:hypothetical protein
MHSKEATVPVDKENALVAKEWMTKMKKWMEMVMLLFHVCVLVIPKAQCL